MQDIKQNSLNVKLQENSSLYLPVFSSLQLIMNIYMRSLCQDSKMITISLNAFEAYGRFADPGVSLLFSTFALTGLTRLLVFLLISPFLLTAAAKKSEILFSIVQQSRTLLLTAVVY